MDVAVFLSAGGDDDGGEGEVWFGGREEGEGGGVSGDAAGGDEGEHGVDVGEEDVEEEVAQLLRLDEALLADGHALEGEVGGVRRGRVVVEGVGGGVAGGHVFVGVGGSAAGIAVVVVAAAAVAFTSTLGGHDQEFEGVAGVVDLG